MRADVEGMAGPGVKRVQFSAENGRVAWKAVDGKVHVPTCTATIFHLLGLGPRKAGRIVTAAEISA